MKYKPGFLTYECDCGAVSYIWNSRAGEVPSFVPCVKAKCGHVMSPIYAAFRFRSSHKPGRFERVVVDLSYTTALQRALAMRQGTPSDDPEVIRLAFSWYKDGKQPHVVSGAELERYLTTAAGELVPERPAPRERIMRRVLAPS